MEMQDLTPQERVDDALLARILNTECDCDGKRARGEDRKDRKDREDRKDCARVSGAYVDARSNGNDYGCGSCGCAYDKEKRVCGFGVEGAVLAAVYVPMQKFEGVYDPETAIRRGTMFEALDKPFYGDKKEVDCRGRER